MTTSIILPDELAHAMEMVATWKRAPSTASPNETDRKRLEMVLASACLGPVALNEYLTNLSALKGRDAGEGPFRLPDATTELVIKEGLAVLSNEQLLGLASNPQAVAALNARVDRGLLENDLGDFWWDAHEVPPELLPQDCLGDEAVNRVLGDFGLRSTSTDAKAPRNIPASSQPTPSRFSLAPLLAMAACLLVGVTVGWLLRGDGQQRQGVLLASGKVEPSNVRGPNEEKLQQVRITAPLKGFAVIVSLAPDRKQRVLPEFGADDLPVAAGTPSEGIPLPADTTRAVFLVTETPAGETVRRALEGRAAKRFSSDQEKELRQELEQLLEKKGFRRFAVGEAAVQPAP